MPHSPEAVANEFLKLADEASIELTPMHLQKLDYIAHGWMLALNDKRLISSQPEAWRFGPVYPTLYDNLKRFGSNVVTDLIRQNNWAGSDSVRGPVVREDFKAPESRIVRNVFREYGDLEAFQLSALTHGEGTPWTTTYVAGKNKPIPNELIQTHFREIAAGR